MRGIAVYSFAVAVLLRLGQTVSGVELMIDGVPTDDAHVSAAPKSASETQKRLLGAWVGTWGGSLRHILIVEDIRAGGEASVVYAIGDCRAPLEPAQGNIVRRYSHHSRDLYRHLQADSRRYVAGDVPKWPGSQPSQNVEDRACRIDPARRDHQLDIGRGLVSRY
jgi:hypothetical protein